MNRRSPRFVIRRANETDTWYLSVYGAGGVSTGTLFCEIQLTSEDAVDLVIALSKASRSGAPWLPLIPDLSV